MNDDEIRQAIIAIIREIAPDEEFDELDPAVRLRDQLELDSMDFLDIVMELRKKYGVQVPDSDYEQLASLASCVEYLRPKMQDKKLAV